MSNDSETRRRKAAYAAFEDREHRQAVLLRLRPSGPAAQRQRDHRAALQPAAQQPDADRPGQDRADQLPQPGGDLRGRHQLVAEQLDRSRPARCADRVRLLRHGRGDQAGQPRVSRRSTTTRRTLPQSTVGIGTRIDVVMVQGAQGADLYWNKTEGPRQHAALRPQPGGRRHRALGLRGPSITEQPVEPHASLIDQPAHVRPGRAFPSNPEPDRPRFIGIQFRPHHLPSSEPCDTHRTTVGRQIVGRRRPPEHTLRQHDIAGASLQTKVPALVGLSGKRWI